MAYINFIIPQTKQELLNESSGNYFVRNVIGVKEIQLKLRVARQCFKDDGPEFILENFDTYFSVLHHAETLPPDLVMMAYEDLHKASKNLNNVLGYLLEDKDSLNDELKLKFQNVTKMLFYIYIQIITFIEQKLESHRAASLQKVRKGNKKQSEDQGEMGCKKRDVILALNNVLQREINILWDPPVVEDTFVTMVAEICYRFLELPLIKLEKDLRVEIFNMLGLLVKNYNHGMTFVVRIVQLIKIHEHLVFCIPEGIQILVQSYNCKSLVRDFVREITEWQTDDSASDTQGTKNCSAILCNTASLMPDLMIPEVMYLNRYLSHYSYTLRNSVLTVICEITLTVLTKNDLTEEEQESRDEFLAVLEEHIADTSAYVRTKVFQHWARLQQENAIPIKMQGAVLEKAIRHLRDRTAVVRKCAANCVTTFLSHNVFGARLQLQEMEAELEQKSQILEQLKATVGFDHSKKLREVQEQWAEREDDIKEVIVEKLKEEYAEEPSGESQIEKHRLPELVRMYVLEDKYDEAFEICRGESHASSEWKEMKQQGISSEQEVGLFLMLMRTIFTDVASNVSSSSQESKRTATEDDLKQLETVGHTVGFLKNSVTFLRLIDSAIKPMVDLLESVAVGDAQEAVAFFVAAYQFNIHNSHIGVIEMLKIMQRNEQERKDLIINAFKTIYLTTDSTNMDEHATVIVNRLTKLLQTIPFENIQDLRLIISQWVSKNIIDHSVINMLWRYFLKKDEVTDKESRAALHLLAMAAAGRKSIVSKNIPAIVSVAFGQRGRHDILLATAACKILEIAGRERKDVTDVNPPFRIKYNESLWKDLVDILVENFHSNNEFYNQFMNNALNCIYQLCSKPEIICERIVEAIINPIVTKMRTSNETQLENYVIAQCANMAGEMAMKELNFLDSCVYKELKRREHQLAEYHSNKNKGNKQKRKSYRNASAIKNMSKNSTSEQSSLIDNSTLSTKDADDSTLEGAAAQDNDAEFILNILENHLVIDNSGLAQLAYIFVTVCEKPNAYDDVYLQGVCVMALMKYMTVSEFFCKKYLQLVFTILERSNYPDVKCNILVHLSDLMERFPNSIEPWTPRIYERLNDSNTKVRTVTFYILSNLILRDMIRAQGHISQMAACIVDSDESIKSMSENFFVQLSHKANNLYNILPDIFSHLADLVAFGEDNLRLIMKFLFGLIDKNKQMENLVERFCSKFRLTEDPYKCRNIAFCLSLIQYNEKGLRRLLESFGYYKNILQNDDVYAIFKQILTVCTKAGKNEMKDIIKEIEDKMNAVLEVNEDGQPNALNTSRVPQTPSKTKRGEFKKPQGKPLKTRTKKTVQRRNSDSDSEEEKENSTPVRKSSRNRKTSRHIDSSDSD